MTRLPRDAADYATRLLIPPAGRRGGLCQQAVSRDIPQDIEPSLLQLEGSESPGSESPRGLRVIFTDTSHAPIRVASQRRLQETRKYFLADYRKFLCRINTKTLYNARRAPQAILDACRGQETRTVGSHMSSVVVSTPGPCHVPHPEFAAPPLFPCYSQPLAPAPPGLSASPDPPRPVPAPRTPPQAPLSPLADSTAQQTMAMGV